MPRKRRLPKEKKLRLIALYDELREMISSGFPWTSRRAGYANSKISDLINGVFFDMWGDGWENEEARMEFTGRQNVFQSDTDQAM
jgi:hypothetical protein